MNADGARLFGCNAPERLGILGLAIPLTLGLLSPFKIPVSPWSAVAALTTSVLVGVLFGTLPANRAARLDPVQTLKYE